MRWLLTALAGLALGACSVNATGAKCETVVNCPPGEGCGLDGRCSPAAVCPDPDPGKAVGTACAQGDPATCASDVVMRCDRSPLSRDCWIWTRIDCKASGLQCDGGNTKCVCPPLLGSEIFADAVGGSRSTDSVSPTGTDQPAQCRFQSVVEALAATGPGQVVVKATGWTGPSVVFAEAAIQIPAGVTLTTDDSSQFTTPHYVLQTLDTGSTPFITLGAGATLSRWEIRNDSATGDALRTSCGATTAVTVDTVKISGTGSGAALPKFRAGIHYRGTCALVITNSTITGVGDSGVLVDAAGPAVTLTNNIITGNTGTTDYTFPGPVTRHGGGVVVAQTIPSSFVFQRNQVYGNKGDQILVAAGVGTLDLRGGTGVGDCGPTSNVISCYDAPAGGKGIYAADIPLEVKADYNEWPTAFPDGNDVSGNVTGLGSWCPPVAAHACR